MYCHGEDRSFIRFGR
ncbi:MAG: hypothetical protein DA445_08020 [Bacteroidetes bacterium]|nr:MAG: hypothetical protein DA445_08020 [Bacteroidota bacterium]